MKLKRLVSLALAVMLMASCLLATACAEEAYVTKGGIKMSAPGQFPITEEKTTISVYIQQLAYHLTDVTTNTFTKEMEELTNVHLDMMVAPSDSYREKLNLLLAGGDYPDVIMSGGFGNADLVKYGTEEGILIPLNDLIDKYGVNIKQRWEDLPSLKADMTTPDGNIYGIPTMESYMVGHTAVNYKLWINTAWLEKLGLERPTTTAEFKDVLIAFRDQDPNGNGLKDEIPLTGASGTWAADPYLFLINAFLHYDGLLTLKDDKFTTPVNQEAFRDAMRYIADLYKEGLIDPAAFTQNEQQMSAVGNNESAVVMGAATAGHIGMAVSINDADRYAMYDCLEPLEGPNGYRGIPFKKDQRTSGATFVITDKCENPELAIRIADYLCSEEAIIRHQVGIKGIDWDDADEGTVTVTGEPATRKYLSFSTSGEGAERNDIWSQTCVLLGCNWKTTFQLEGDIRDVTNYESYLLQETENLRQYASDVQQIPPYYMNEEDSARLSQLSSPLSDYVKSWVVGFITGSYDIEADWDEYVKGLNDLRIDEYIALNQAAYDALAK